MAAMSVIGIDFGNESCYVAVARAGGIETIANDYSLRATPSCVAFSERNRILGVAAKNQLVTNMKNTVYGFKRLLGRKFNDPHVQNELKHLTFPVIEHNDHGIGIKVNYLGEEKIFSPEQITAMLFTKLKEVSEIAIKTQVNDCVISVPSYYTVTERSALLAAAEIAGLNVLRLMNETAATALSYGIYKQDLPAAEEKPRNVVFVDCGHSALQVAACAFHKGKLKMLSSACDSNLGGRDFDYLLADHFATGFKSKYGVDAKSNPRAFTRLLTEVEKLKKQMSANSTKLPINIECFMNDKDVHGDMKRSEMEKLSAQLLSRVEKTLKQCLDESKLSLDDIHSVEIVGGGSRVPSIKQLIEQVFKKQPSTTLNQDEAVARGCALQCALLSPAVRVREFSLTDILPYSVKLVWDPSAGEDGQMEVFSKHHQMPFSKLLTFFRKEPFSMKAYYNCSIPYPDNFIGEFRVKDVKPTAEGDSTKVKVKCRVNLHGIVGIVGATMLEKKDPTEEAAEVEVAKDHKSGDSGSEPPPADPPSSQENGDIDMEESDKKDGKKKKASMKTVDLPVEEVHPHYSRSHISDFYELECKMVSSDRQEKERADARNALEEYVYDLRSKLSDDYEPYVLPNDREKYVSELDSMESWLYEEGEDVQRQIYADKLSSLKKIGKPIKRRKNEFEARSGALEEIGQCLQLSQKFVDSYKKNEKYSHITSEEVNKVEEAILNCAKWLEEKRAILHNCPKTSDAPVSIKDIRNEKMCLETILTSTMNKPKPAPPAPEQPPKDDEQPPPTADGQQPADSKGENMDVD